MLQDIRDKSQGWITWIILGVIIVVFALFGISYYLNAGPGTEKTVATVNGEPISQNSFNYIYQSVSNQSENASTDSTALQQQALHMLINREILLQSAQDLGFRISTQELDQIIYSIPGFQVNGQFSMPRYQAVLQNLGMTTDELKSELMTDILVGQVQAGITSSQFVLPNEVNMLNQILNQKRDISYSVLPSSKFASTTNISQDQIQTYYEANQSSFYTTEQVQLQYIMLNASSLPKGKSYADIGNQLANLSYENPNSLDYTAKQLGLNVQTSGLITQTGGAGWLSNPQVLQAAFSDSVLRQGNDSDVINLSPTQCVVIRVAKDIPSTVKPLSAVQSQIVATLQAEAGQQKAQQVAQSIYGALQNGNGAGPILKQYGLNWQQATLSRASKNMDPAMIDAAFSTAQPLANQPIPAMASIQNGYAIILVNKAYSSNGASNPADKLALLHALSVLDYDQYTQALVAIAKVKVQS
ncbi:MAG: hypothetical protein K0R66_1547 [Gammaproteobacteria bacterium]|nr:hypothetical protein [Gammaproteobacteria bacterium]